LIGESKIFLRAEECSPEKNSFQQEVLKEFTLFTSDTTVNTSLIKVYFKTDYFLLNPLSVMKLEIAYAGIETQTLEETELKLVVMEEGLLLVVAVFSVNITANNPGLLRFIGCPLTDTDE
jgi:hypothetical protein